MVKDLESRFPITKYALSGVSSTGGVENPNTRQYPESKSLASRCGQIAEHVAMRAWTDPTFEIVDPEAFFHSANQVRTKILHLQETDLKKRGLDGNTIYRINADINPIYQALTEPPQVQFLGDERVWPSWQPLEELFYHVDRNFGSDYQKQFQLLGETHSGSGIVNGKIRILTESALVLARLASEPPPFPGHHIVPDVRFSNVTQFDALVSHFPLESGNLEQITNMKDNVELLEGFDPLDLKFDVRARHTTGFKNRLDKLYLGPLPRHKREMQQKIINIVKTTEQPFELPNGFVLIYLRGTLENAIYTVQLDHKFLNEWKLGIRIQKDRNALTGEQINTANLIEGMIDYRLFLLTHMEMDKREKAESVMPMTKLHQAVISLNDTSDEVSRKPITQVPDIEKVSEKEPERERVVFQSPKGHQKTLDEALTSPQLEIDKNNITFIELNDDNLELLKTAIDEITYTLSESGNEAVESAIEKSLPIGWGLLHELQNSDSGYQSNKLKVQFLQLGTTLTNEGLTAVNNTILLDASALFTAIQQHVKEQLISGQTDAKAAFRQKANELTLLKYLKESSKERVLHIVFDNDLNIQQEPQTIREIGWYKGDYKKSS